MNPDSQSTLDGKLSIIDRILSSVTSRKPFWLCLFGILAFALVQLKDAPLPPQAILAGAYLAALILDMVLEKWAASATQAQKQAVAEPAALQAVTHSPAAAPEAAPSTPETTPVEPVPVAETPPPKATARQSRPSKPRSSVQEPCITPPASLPSAA